MNYSLSLPFSTLGYGKKVNFTVGAALLGSAKHLSSEQQRNVNFTRSSAWISFNGKPTRTLSAKEIGWGTVREWACLEKNDLSLGKAYILLQLVCRLTYEAAWNLCVSISFFSFFFISLRGKWCSCVCVWCTYVYMCFDVIWMHVCRAACIHISMYLWRLTDEVMYLLLLVSTFLLEARSLSLTQSSQIWLVWLASLFWGSWLCLPNPGITRGPLHLLAI